MQTPHRLPRQKRSIISYSSAGFSVLPSGGSCRPRALRKHQSITRNRKAKGGITWRTA